MPTRYPRPPPSFWRLNGLNVVRSELFNNVYNPKAERLGNKILKKRFRAQAIQDYYPMDFKFTPRVLGRLFPGLQFEDEYREEWEEFNEEYARMDRCANWQEKEKRERSPCKVFSRKLDVRLICVGKRRRIS